MLLQDTSKSHRLEHRGLLLDCLKNPYNLHLQNIYKDWCLDNNYNSLYEQHELVKKISPLLFASDNQTFVTEIFTTSLNVYVETIKDLLNNFPITKVSYTGAISKDHIRIFTTDTYYYWSNSRLNINSVPQCLYFYLKPKKSVFHIYYKSEVEARQAMNQAMMKYLEEVRNKIYR